MRDRLGVKPLVYAVSDGQLAFASTVRALRLGGFVGEIDEQAVAEYLEFGYVTDERAIMRAWRKCLPPDCRMGGWATAKPRLLDAARSR